MGKTYTFFLYHTYPNYREALKNYPIKTLFRYITLKKGLINKRKLMTSFVFIQTIYIFGIANKQIILKRK